MVLLASDPQRARALLVQLAIDATAEAVLDRAASAEDLAFAASRMPAPSAVLIDDRDAVLHDIVTALLAGGAWGGVLVRVLSADRRPSVAAVAGS